MQQHHHHHHPGESYARDEQKPTTAVARAVSLGNGHASLVCGPQAKQRSQQQQQQQQGGDRLSQQPCHGITLEKKRHIISLLPDTARLASSVVDKHKRLSQRLCREREQRWESPSDVEPHASPPPDAGARTRREHPEAKSAKSGNSRRAPGETLSDKENDAQLPAAADGRRGRAWEGSGAGSVPMGDQINVGKCSKVPFNVLTSQQEAFNGRRETVSMVCPGNAFPSAPHSSGASDRLPTSPAKPDPADGSLHELSSSLPMPEPSGGSPLLSRHRARSRSVSLPLKADSKVQDLPSFANIREFTVEDGRAISRAGTTSGPALHQVYRGEHEFPGGGKATRRVEDACLCHYAALGKDALAHSRGDGPAVAEASCGQRDAVTVGRNPWLLQREYVRGPVRYLQGTSPFESHFQSKVQSTPLNVTIQLKPKAFSQNSHALNRSYEVQTPSPLWQQCSKHATDAVAFVPHGVADPAVESTEQRGCVRNGTFQRVLSMATPACRREERGAVPDERGIHIVAFKEKQRQLRDWHALHHNPVADKPVQKYDQKDSKLQEQWAFQKLSGFAGNGSFSNQENENGKHSSPHCPHLTDRSDGAVRSCSAASQTTGVLLTRSSSVLGLLTRSHRRGPRATAVANLLDVQKRSNRVSAVVKGFLTRRLLRTEKVQRLVSVIKDTRQLALSIQGDLSTKCLGPSDSAFRTRLLKQIQGALDEIHNIFFVLSPGQRMAILKTDEEVRQAKGLRTTEKGMVTHGTKSVSSRPLKLKLHHT
ncbi:uncharacterized protein LOC116957996 isoform X2 [Petromyzon marinus]|uniref:uncharacterized protein LOC116957996 isoform X2 n=1 Tax=Petromyzon marinus TaxID=7757 RepID=UPI003F7167FE